MGNVTALAFSTDGGVLASSCGDDGSIRVWISRPQSNQYRLARSLWGHREGVTSIAVSGDGRLLVSGSLGETVKLWSIDQGEVLRTFVAEG